MEPLYWQKAERYLRESKVPRPPLGPQCSYHVTGPPRHMPKTQEVSSKPLGLAKSYYPDACPQECFPNSDLKGSPASCCCEFSPDGQSKGYDKIESKFLSYPRSEFLSLCGPTVRKCYQNPTHSSFAPPDQ